MDVEGDRAAVSIVGADLSPPGRPERRGPRGSAGAARLPVFRETGERSRLMLDISGFRAEKRTELERLAEETVTQVKADGQPVSLDPMSPFERKVVTTPWPLPA